MMMRSCPHSDSMCRHGMACPYTCATDKYDGTKTMNTPKPPSPTVEELIAEVNARYDLPLEYPTDIELTHWGDAALAHALADRCDRLSQSGGEVESRDAAADCALAVGRWVYRRIDAIADAKAGTPNGDEALYLSALVVAVEEYDATGENGVGTPAPVAAKPQAKGKVESYRAFPLAGPLDVRTAAGIVEEWRDRAMGAEARAAQLEAALEHIAGLNIALVGKGLPLTVPAPACNIS